MSIPPRVARILVATVTVGRVRALDELAKMVIDEFHPDQASFVRGVVVKGEPEFIQQLVSNVANDNEADAIIMLGGTGFGPRDGTCEALDRFFERRIEGFGEAYRRLLREEFDLGPAALLARATAGVYNQCLVFALTGQPDQVRRAIQQLVVPTLSDAVRLATGDMRVHDSMNPIARSTLPKQAGDV